MSQQVARLRGVGALSQRYAEATRRTKVIVCLVVVGLILAVVLAVSLIRLWQVAGHLSTARAALVRAEDDVRAGNIQKGRGDVVAAETEILAATNILHGSRELNLAGPIPVVHQNLQAVKRSVALALQMSDSGRRLLETAQPLAGPDGRVNVSLTNGTVPLDTVVKLQQQLQELTFALPGRGDVPSNTLLLGKVSSLQRKVYTEAARRREQFASAARALSLLGEMGGANGPRHYLIAVANAAEMRGTGGMILSYGVLSSDSGAFKLDHFGSIDEIALPAPADVNPAPSYVARFSAFSPTLNWRNANMGADYLDVAPVMASMYQKATGNPVDGVIQIDSMGLSALLRGVGPVTVPDLGVVNADNAVALTLNEAYTRFPDRPVRQEYLGQIANAAFDKLLSGNYPGLRELASALAGAANHRNVIFWSSKPNGERPASYLNADGRLPDTGDFAALTLENLTGNKLDYYVDTGLRMQGSRPRGQLGHLRVAIDIRNAAPQNGRPPYIFGPFQPGLQAGEYDGLVNLYVPVGTSVAGSAGLDDPGSLALGADGDRTVVSFRTVLQAGQARTFTLDLQLPPRPPGTYRFDLTPAPRVRPTAVAVDISAGDRRIRYTGSLVAPIELP